MPDDRFEATVVVGVDRATAWRRLTAQPIEGDRRRLWLPGFAGPVTVDDEDPDRRREATKDDEPCAGTAIVVTLEDVEDGTRITVVQSGFGDWMPPVRDVMAVGWRHLVADLQSSLATGVHAERHLLPWFDLGADVVARDGGLRLGEVRPGSLAARLGLEPDDLLVVLAGAPVTGHDDLTTVLRVLGDDPSEVSAAWIRRGSLESVSR